jgi:predicted dehydrogenase
MSELERNRVRDRRLFLQGVTAVAAASMTGTPRVWGAVQTPVRSANDLIRVGIMGVNGRGAALASGFMAASGAEVGTLCDVDSRALERCAKRVEERQGKVPKLTGDFRTMLEDPEIDALIVAAPNHWHAPATIMGCDAGKHVYVEKPCSHNPQEGEWAVAAARQHQRVVQMGTQRRSWPAIREAISKVQDGAIGEVRYARTWYNNRRGPVGVGKEVPVPEWLDWELWQGPAPRVAYRDNIVHYQWHWHWDWGNGELGNNGVHAIDVARWGLQVTYPKFVTAGGGKYRHEDDQQTPDTMMVTIDFPENKTITWEGLSWSPLGVHDSRFGISFHGTEGSIVIPDSGYVVFDMQGKEVETFSGPGGDSTHVADFLGAIRESRLPNADILEAHRSTWLCHLGNIAYRTRTVLETDPRNGHIVGNERASGMWRRDYAEGWSPR